MKTTIIMIISYLCVLLSSNAQNTEPTPFNFVWGSSPNARPFVLDSFPMPNTFQLGWEWGGSWKMTEAMNMNTHIGSTPGLYPVADWDFLTDGNVCPTNNS